MTAITAFPVPTTRRELRRFLGMAGYYCGFCRNFSSVVAPLTSLLSPLVPFAWSPDCQHAFVSVKTLLCSTPVLVAPDFEKPFKMEVDACNVGAGAVLIQEDSIGLDHPVCYFLRKFNECQTRYSTIDRKLWLCCLRSSFLKFIWDRVLGLLWSSRITIYWYFSTGGIIRISASCGGR